METIDAPQEGTARNDGLLQLYTQYLRRDLTESGYRREEAPPVIRYINRRGTHSLILYNEMDNLSPQEIEAVGERERTYFHAMGHSVEWKIFDYDLPRDLRFMLEKGGYVLEPEEAVMLLDISRIPEQLVVDGGRQTRRHRPCMPGGSLAPRRVTDPDDLPRILTAVQNRAFQSSFDTPTPAVNHPMEGELTARMAEDPDSMDFFVIIDKGEPVSAAWMLYFGDAPIAGLYGGATVPEYRRRGLYTSLVSARARAARDRGIRYLTVDAGKMSEPILRTLGFQKIASTWPVSYIA